MKQIDVEISGEKLLMNSPKAMLLQEDSMKSKMKKRIPQEEAEKVAYRRKDGMLYIPNTAIRGSMINASAFKKFGKFSAKPIIASAIRIEPEEISLGTKNYEIDARTVVIQRNRVVKCRPVIKNWKATFTLVYNDELIAKLGIFHG